MKVAIIAPTVMREMPYINIYIKTLNEENIDFDIINWDRFNEEEEEVRNKYTYKGEIKNNRSLLKKYINFIKYQIYIKKILNKNKYDKLIILCPQTIILIYKFIINRYKENYILDIRDYSIINKLNFIIKDIINNSFFTAISSEGYLQWLPNLMSKYVISNNINDCSIIKSNNQINIKNNIIIATIGSIRDFKGNKKVIDSLKNINNISIEFYGKGIDEDRLRKYCKDNEVNNSKFYGKYDSSEEDSIYKKVDFVNAYTEEINNIGFLTAMPNRIYKSAKFTKPIIVRKNTYLGNVVEKFNLGISVDLSKDDLSIEIKKYIQNFDQNEFKKNCIDFLSEVNEEVKFFEKKLNLFLKKKKNEEKYYGK